MKASLQKKPETARAMKIAVINFSGNVGKTTIAKQLIAPRFDAPEFSVETSNARVSHDTTSKRIDASNYELLQKELIVLDSAIVDIGASNAQEFIKLMGYFRDSHEEFDYFVVPVVSEKKQQTDTINTIETLSSLGVSADKILLVYNMVDIGRKEDIARDFALVRGYHAAEKKFTLNNDAVLYNNEIYDRLRSLKMNVTQIAEDQTDYRQVLADAKDDSEKQRPVNMIIAKRLAKSAQQNLDDVYNVLFG